MLGWTFLDGNNVQEIEWNESAIISGKSLLFRGTLIGTKQVGRAFQTDKITWEIGVWESWFKFWNSFLLDWFR